MRSKPKDRCDDEQSEEERVRCTCSSKPKRSAAKRSRAFSKQRKQYKAPVCAIERRSVKVKAKQILLLCINLLLGYSRFGHTIIRLNKIMQNNFLLIEIYAIRFSAKRDFDQTLLCNTRLGK
ncbi:hypothetical protein JYU34_001770 [Plutella xylostella]|uniref:Uncharacterized protein n=1 Tax=Plutella xylostella TaxID=51655 RepID=A0ABQ7R4R7_PLUXY|nr:hypothetical protein JYU34_001770 [Plutella xylostella]